MLQYQKENLQKKLKLVTRFKNQLTLTCEWLIMAFYHIIKE
jgi:hypothetical protein